jgi:hypothetical protein
MIERANETPGYGFGYASAAVPPPPPGRAPLGGYELRPLSTGEILDRTFSLYRGNFWLFCGLSAGAAVFQVATSLVQILFLSSAGKMATAQDAVTALVGAGVSLLASLVYFAAYSVAQAATASAVLSTYLGHETSAKQALKAIGGKWLRYVAILFWQFWSAFWIFTLLLIPAVALAALRVTSLTVLSGVLVFAALGSLVYGFIAYIRNSLAIAASVMEGLPIRASMRRSKTLAAGNKWRIFLLLLLLFALSLVAGAMQAPFLIVLGLHPVGRHFAARGLSLLIAFFTSSLIGPVGAIGFCLFYIDARVRKEGFDIEALMDPTLGPGVLKVAAPVDLLPSGFAPSGFTASSGIAPAPPAAGAAAAGGFAPSGFTASSSPFPPSQFAAAAPVVEQAPFAPSGMTEVTAVDERAGLDEDHG